MVESWIDKVLHYIVRWRLVSSSTSIVSRIYFEIRFISYIVNYSIIYQSFLINILKELFLGYSIDMNKLCLWLYRKSKWNLAHQRRFYCFLFSLLSNFFTVFLIAISFLSCHYSLHFVINQLKTNQYCSSDQLNDSVFPLATFSFLLSVPLNKFCIAYQQ